MFDSIAGSLLSFLTVARGERQGNLQFNSCGESFGAELHIKGSPTAFKWGETGLRLGLIAADPQFGELYLSEGHEPVGTE